MFVHLCFVFLILCVRLSSAFLPFHRFVFASSLGRNRGIWTEWIPFRNGWTQAKRIKVFFFLKNANIKTHMNAQWAPFARVLFFSSIEEKRNHGVTAATIHVSYFSRKLIPEPSSKRWKYKRRKRKDIIMVIVINKTAALQMLITKIISWKMLSKKKRTQPTRKRMKSKKVRYGLEGIRMAMHTGP